MLAFCALTLPEKTIAVPFRTCARAAPPSPKRALSVRSMVVGFTVSNGAPSEACSVSVSEACSAAQVKVEPRPTVTVFESEVTATPCAPSRDLMAPGDPWTSETPVPVEFRSAADEICAEPAVFARLIPAPARRVLR